MWAFGVFQVMYKIDGVGVLIEGVLERDPYGKLYVQETGAEPQDLEQILKPYEGQEVRLTIASVRDLQTTMQTLQQQGVDLPPAVMMQDLKKEG